MNEKHLALGEVFEKAAKTLPKQKYKVLQEDSHPIGLTFDRWFRQKMDYLNDNPVRNGFVESPEHWRYNDYCTYSVHFSKKIFGLIYVTLL